MKKKILIILIFLIILSIIVFSILGLFLRPYNLRLIEKKIDGGNLKINLPKRWGGYDTREVYENREGYESKLIFRAVNFGGFPRVEIYEIDNLTSSSIDEKYELLKNWDISRMGNEGELDNRSDIQSEEYFSGKVITFFSDSNQPMLTSTVCKDWLSISQNSGYIISICERENRWSRLDEIYPDIIKSFTKTD